MQTSSSSVKFLGSALVTATSSSGRQRNLNILRRHHPHDNNRQKLAFQQQQQRSSFHSSSLCQSLASPATTSSSLHSFAPVSTRSPLFRRRCSRSCGSDTRTMSPAAVVDVSSKATCKLVEDLLAANPNMRVRDSERVETLLTDLIAGGADKLQLVIDFDHTLTKTHNDRGDKVDCSWGVLENSPLLPPDYTTECSAIKAKYLPIEHDPQMSIEEKIPHMVAWYTEANKALQKCGVRRTDFTAMVAASNVELREATDDMLTILSNASVPVLVLSAGIGDLIVEILKTTGVYHDNIKVVSNFLAFNDEGRVIGLEGEIIHVYNKNESAIHDSDYFKELQTRQNVILLGDSLGDLQMADGLNNPGGILKIGFLNFNVEERLDAYMMAYDIVILNDQTMKLPLSIVNKVVVSRN